MLCTCKDFVYVVIRRGAIERQMSHWYKNRCGIPIMATLRAADPRLAEEWRRADADVDNSSDACHALETGGLIRLNLWRAVRPLI